MMRHPTVVDRLEHAAQNGVYSFPLFVWNNTAKRLKKEGLILNPTEIKSQRKGESYYNIAWDHATVNIPDGPFDFDDMLKELLSKGVSLNEANILWLKSEECNRKKCK